VQFDPSVTAAMSTWTNWSGSVTAAPADILRPKTESKLSAIVARARKMRVAGAGHSFMPLCETDGTLLSLSDLEGEVEVSVDRTRAWAPAGWSLAKLTAALWEKGVSLINQGDVNPQALAGAIATGTHGTGATLGSISTAARAFHLVLADGSVVTCSASERPELFQAQRLSLGLLGVATRIEIDVLPAYHLEERIETLPLDDVAERWDELRASNRHVEFFVFPYADTALLKMLNPASAEGEMKEEDDENEAFRMVCEACMENPALIPTVQPNLVPSGVKKRRVGPAYRIFPSERTVPFEEMEYELPRAAGWPALREVIAMIRKRELPVTFPFELRLTAGDDIWLSPFHIGPGASISMHQYAKMPFRDVFAAAEPIFRAHGGRPHWAKRHTLTWRDVEALYPNASRFRDVVRAHDPQGKFANAHLSELFEL
jgi:FAD-linked oxidoreductase